MQWPKVSLFVVYQGNRTNKHLNFIKIYWLLVSVAVCGVCFIPVDLCIVQLSLLIGSRVQINISHVRLPFFFFVCVSGNVSNILCARSACVCVFVCEWLVNFPNEPPLFDAINTAILFSYIYRFISVVCNPFPLYRATSTRYSLMKWRYKDTWR